MALLATGEWQPLGIAQLTLGGFFSYLTLTTLMPHKLSQWPIFTLAAIGGAGTLTTNLDTNSTSITWWALSTITLTIVATLGAVVSSVQHYITQRRLGPTSLVSFYNDAVAARRLRHDAQQAMLVEHLQQLVEAFARYRQRRSRPWGFVYQPPQGVYLCGPAGRGKTFLLDAFYQILPNNLRQRYHFHEVMALLLDELHQVQGQRQAVQQVAESLATPGSLVCLDELNLLDITGARLLQRLLQAWWQQGTVVCITSNMTVEQLFTGVAVPDDEQQLAIQQLRQHCQPWLLDQGQDYRANKLGAADLYQYPASADTTKNLASILHRLAEGKVHQTPIVLNNIHIECLGQAGAIAWFDFHRLCDAPLGYREYLALVNQFPTLMVSNVPQLQQEDSARRFAWLVELIYDAKKRLIVAAHVPLPELFTPGLSSTGQSADFGKIMSRLTEMQSSEYNYVLATDA